MWNARLDDSQAGIKIAGRNINNFTYADDITLVVEINEELKSLSMKVKEEHERAGLKLNIQNMKIIVSSPITSWQIGEIVTDFIFSSSKISVDSDCNHNIKRCLLLGKKSYDKPRECVKKQRHHFANNALLYSQNYGFSSCHVWMWELDHKEGWAPKN